MSDSAPSSLGRLLRLLPKRSPPLVSALAVTLGALAVGVLVRLIVLGPNAGFGTSITYIPALVVATLYAGPLWGWLMLGLILVINLVWPSVFATGSQGPALIGLYFVSAALIVAASAALREALLRLEAANARQESIQAALNASEARLQRAQEAGGVGLWDWDVLTGDGYWSSVLYRNVGIDPSEGRASPRRLLEVVHPDDRELVRETNIVAVKEGRMEPIEYRVIWPDGQVRWLLSRGEMMTDEAGRIVRAVGVNIDVTERHRAIERLQESEARFRALADSAPVLLWVSRTDGKREFANRAYVDFLGDSYESALAFDWRRRLHPDDLARILSEQTAGEASRKPFILEARYQRADGEWRWIRSVSQPRWGPGGEFSGFIGIGYDVTEAKAAEEDLRRINELLAERVAAALAERDDAEAALRRAQKMEAVGQLTGGVAHDFNNLLTVIIGALDLIQRHPEDAPRRERMIEAALGAARRGERLTQQLLAFSRRQALRPEAVRPDDLVREAEPLLRRVVGEAVALTVAPAAPDAVAMIDAGQFEAALMNLVVNARDALDGAGPAAAIRVETSHCKLSGGEVEEVDAGDYVCLSVHDTGMGMSEEIQARVFEPFFTTKEIGKGTGLGLSQVYGFVRQSGGGIAIDSAPGKGATFRIYLPRAAREAVPAPLAASADAVRPQGPRLSVLLVEDDAAVGDMVQGLLEELGHSVARAGDVREALDRLAQAAPDLLVTDLIMPGGRTGVELAREATAARPDLPVVLCSGYTGKALESADGAPWPLLRKPFSALALAQAIEAALGASGKAP